MHTCVLRPLLNNLPPGLAREGYSLLVDDRSVLEREREKNSTDLSRSYHAAITWVIHPSPVRKRVMIGASPLRGGRQERIRRVFPWIAPIGQRAFGADIVFLTPVAFLGACPYEIRGRSSKK